MQAPNTHPLTHTLAEITQHLAAISQHLAIIAAANSTAEPNYQRSLTDYAAFDWASIGANILESDQAGPTVVGHNNFVYTRRSPQNKFDAAIWYSRADGKDEDGNVKYLRLITFKQTASAEPVPQKVAAQLAKASPPPQTTQNIDLEGVRAVYKTIQNAPLKTPQDQGRWAKACDLLNSALEQAKLPDRIVVDLLSYKDIATAKTAFVNLASKLAS